MIRRGAGNARSEINNPSFLYNSFIDVSSDTYIEEDTTASSALVQKLLSGELGDLSQVEKDKLSAIAQRLKTIDSPFGEVAEFIEMDWLKDANAVLTEAVASARSKLKCDNTTLAELNSFIDKMYGHVRLHNGLPTTLVGHDHRHRGKLAKKTDKELDGRILELQKGLGYIVTEETG